MAYTIEQIRLERDEKILQAFKRLRLPGMAGHFREILDGKHDELPENAFLMVGTIEDAVAKAKKLQG